jgi:ABC-type Fe3+/spermidine/putrescine transport system ATPase subunit
MSGPAVAGTPLRVEAVSKSYADTPALEAVSLEFVPGGFNTLLGPSGCGKTTLLRVIAGFVLPDRGRVLIGGTDHTATPPWRRQVGFVFQTYALWPHMSVFDNVAYGLRLRRLPGPVVRERVERALARVSLPGAGQRHPGQLSGGQQQRVALARALVLEPSLLLLDEPLSNLDARLRVEMRRELVRLQREVGITTVHVTHDQDEALELSDQVAVMSRGRVEQVGTAEEVYRRPRTAFVAAFLGATNLLEGEAQADGSLRAHGLRLPCGLPASLAGRRVRVAVRPENVRLGEDPSRAALAGEVVDCAYLGADFRLTVRVSESLCLLARAPERLSPGDPVGLALRDVAVVSD